jgi:antibiotic biosynthesis monooxygenase (ABM) superfamily enzyme
MRISIFEQATLMITARPAAGAEAEWERICHQTTLAVSKFPGHLGTTVLRPPRDSDGTYHIVVKFDTVDHLEGWRNSPERAMWVGRMRALEAAPRSDVTVSGLETWFEQPGHGGQPLTAPPKWKMAIVVWIAVYATVLPLLSVIRPLLGGHPRLLASAVGAAASVILMTWIVMPLLSWLFRGWLYPTTAGGGYEREPGKERI